MNFHKPLTASALAASDACLLWRLYPNWRALIEGARDPDPRWVAQLGADSVLTATATAVLWCAWVMAGRRTDPRPQRASCLDPSGSAGLRGPQASWSPRC